MTATLSILIPTIADVERQALLSRLLDRLIPQQTDSIKIVTFHDEGYGKGGLIIGAKRQRMIESCDTPYLCFVDDDDLVADEYCQRILEAIDRGADVVGFRLRQFSDGGIIGYTTHSLRFDRWKTIRHDDGLMRYERTPNHLNPIRTEIALAIGYKALRSGEDADYSERLYSRFGKTMKEIFIDAFLYDYLYLTKQSKPIEQYREGNLTYEAMQETIRNGGSVMLNGRICTKIEQLA